MAWSRQISGSIRFSLLYKGMQDKQMEVLEAIKMFCDMGLNSTGGLSNNSQRYAENISVRSWIPHL